MKLRGTGLEESEETDKKGKAPLAIYIRNTSKENFANSGLEPTPSRIPYERSTN